MFEHNQDNFQLHRFTTSENIAKKLGALHFLTHTCISNNDSVNLLNYQNIHYSISYNSWLDYNNIKVNSREKLSAAEKYRNIFIHSFIKPLDRRWVVVPSILLNHWLCPMQHQRRVLCRLPVVASTDGEAGHVDVSTAACCRGGDQFLPWQPDAVPCGPQWLLEVVLRMQYKI